MKKKSGQNTPPPSLPPLNLTSQSQTSTALPNMGGQANAVDSWWRTQSATMSLLKHAYTLIENAEKRVEEQEERILRLESLLSIDPLTSLLNRRGFESFFEREIARAKRHDTKGGLLILFDLDRFKAVNDTYGHLAGDECLKMMANKLGQMIRNVDAAARLGGDEFAVILTDTDEKGGIYKCQKLQKNLDSISFKWQDHTVEFGATLGHCFFSGDSQIKDVFDDADKTLYANKTVRKSHR